MIYMKQGNDILIVEHTEIDEELKGQNIGYQLANAVIDYARTHHLKIIPMCPFMNAVISKKPEFRDVLAD